MPLARAAQGPGGLGGTVSLLSKLSLLPRPGGEGLVLGSGLLLATPRRDHIYSFKCTLPGGPGLSAWSLTLARCLALWPLPLGSSTWRRSCFCPWSGGLYPDHPVFQCSCETEALGSLWPGSVLGTDTQEDTLTSAPSCFIVGDTWQRSL